MISPKKNYSTRHLRYMEHKVKNKIYDFISGIRTPILVGIPFLSGLAIGTIVPAITKHPYSGSPFDKAVAISVLFLWGISGWVILLRGDFPLPPPFKTTRGVHVRVVGLFMVLIFWELVFLHL